MNTKTMYYEVHGKGPVVVLIHGFIEQGSMWKDLVKILSASYRVLIPDLPGFGQSVLLRKTVSMDWYAEQIANMLQQEQVKKCVVLGHSMGGYVALYLAEQYPELLKGLGLVNSHAFADTTEKKNNRKKSNEFIQRYGSAPFVKELYNHIFSKDYIQKHPAHLEKLINQASAYTPDALIAANTAMMNRKDKAHVLAASPYPVLFISGKQDESVPLENSLKQATIPDVAVFHLYQNSRHMSIFECKKQAHQAILAYLEMVSPNTTGKS